MQEMIDEWAQSPVNEELVKLIRAYLDDIRLTKGEDCYFSGEPQKSQEALVRLNTTIANWEEVIDMLMGDWETLREEEDE